MRGFNLPALVALRAHSGPAFAKREAKVGDRLTVSAKVENTSAEPAPVTLHVEGLHTGAVRAPVDHDFAFEPASAVAPPKTRKVLEFAWVATLPEGKDAFTFRGKLVLRSMADMKVVGESPLDLYVRR